MANRLSINMAGGNGTCSGSCVYCSAQHVMNPNETNTFDRDWDALKKTIDKCPLTKGKLESVDLWNNGGNPLDWWDAFRETVEWLEKTYPGIVIHSSDNGLSFQSDEKCDYLIKHNIHMQLSHDGYGQWLRTGEIDPCYWEKTAPNIEALVQLGIIDWINCTLTRYNWSFQKNMEYWNKLREKWRVADKYIYIKLNHIFASDYYIDKINTFGHWQDGYDKSLIGKPIGNLSLTGRELDNYLHEYFDLAIFCKMSRSRGNMKFEPFRAYIEEQSQRFKFLGDNECSGMCSQFQKGLIDYSFTVDTMGRYTQCNLIDGAHKVDNPTGKQADYCKGCKYERLHDCNPCGSMAMPKECEYLYKLAQTNEKIFWVTKLLEDKKESIVNVLTK